MKHSLDNYDSDKYNSRPATVEIEPWDGNLNIVSVTCGSDKFSVSTDDLYRVAKMIHEKKQEETQP